MHAYKWLPLLLLLGAGCGNDLIALIAKSPCVGQTSSLQWCPIGAGAGYTPGNGADNGGRAHCCTNQVYEWAEDCDIVGSSSTDVQGSLTTQLQGYANGRCKIKDSDIIGLGLQLVTVRIAEHQNRVGHCSTHTNGSAGACQGNDKINRHEFDLQGTITTSGAISAECAAEIKRNAASAGASISVDSGTKVISVGKFALCDVEDHAPCGGTGNEGTPSLPPGYANMDGGWIYRGPAGNTSCQPNANACLNCLATNCCRVIISCESDPTCYSAKTDLSNCLQNATSSAERQACFNQAPGTLSGLLDCAAACSSCK
jgi:hypothetical protein